MEVFDCSKLFFNILGKGLFCGCFGVTGLFSAAFVRLRILKLVDLAYSWFVLPCLHVDVLMGAYVLL